MRTTEPTAPGIKSPAEAGQLRAKAHYCTSDQMSTTDLPYSLESEAGCLGCILQANGNSYELLTQLKESYFHDIRHRAIYRAMVELWEEWTPLDALPLIQKLKARNALESAGGMDYIATLPDQTPSPANFPYFLEDVRDKAARRRMVVDANALLRRAKDPSAKVEIEEVSDIAPIPWHSLLEPVSYSDNQLGDRFLEAGQGFILFGPSGSGKSVAALQMGCEWAAGLPGLHIRPERPLRVVVLQTEDSLNDQREVLSGILDDPKFTPEHQKLVQDNLVILPQAAGGSPGELARAMDRYAAKFKPDMISVNPLLAFCDKDPTKELGGILYQHIDPVLKRRKISFLGVHHTTKTNNKDTSQYKSHDYQYLAAGDARVANWPRAMISIEEVGRGVYRFRLAKRDHRAGWTLNGKATDVLYFRRHRPIRWVDATLEDVHESEWVENYRVLVSVLPNPDQEPISRDRIRDLAKKTINVGKHKADSWLKLLIEDKLVEQVQIETENKRHAVLFRLKEVRP